jgi:thioredoxin-like negative regulator of GroEL
LIIDPDNPQAFYLYGWLVQGHLNLDKAEEYFMKVVNSSRASAQDKARAYMGIAVARLNRASRAAAHPIDPQTAKVDALQAYAAACAADPELADPRFHCAVLLNDLQRYADAIKELDGLAGLNWLDSGLRKQVTEQMQIARTKKPAKK